MHHIKCSHHNKLYLLQLACPSNHSVDNPISSYLHNSYYYLNLVGLNPSLFNWTLDFLDLGRPQSAHVSYSTSSTAVLSTGAPQGCVLSPALFTLLTHKSSSLITSFRITQLW